MKSRRSLSVLLTFAVFALVEIAFAEDPVVKDSDPIWGKWNSPAVISGGKVSKWNQEFLIGKEHLLMRRRGGENGEIWSYTIDFSKRPRQITMVMASWPDHESGRPQQINAIYEQTEKGVRIAYLPGRNGSSLDQRPTDMTSTAANQAVVMILTPYVVNPEIANDIRNAPREMRETTIPRGIQFLQTTIDESGTKVTFALEEAVGGEKSVIFPMINSYRHCDQ